MVCRLRFCVVLQVFCFKRGRVQRPKLLAYTPGLYSEAVSKHKQMPGQGHSGGKFYLLSLVMPKRALNQAQHMEVTVNQRS